MSDVIAELSAVIESRNDIKLAIENKGQNVNTDIRTYANAIENISANSVMKLPDGTKFVQSTFTTFPNFDTSEIVDMANMFYDCYKLQTINNLDMSNTKYIFGMFKWCGDLSYETRENIVNFLPYTNQLIDSKLIMDTGLSVFNFIDGDSPMDTTKLNILYNKGYLDCNPNFIDMEVTYNISMDSEYLDDLSMGYNGTLNIERLKEYIIESGGESAANIVISSTDNNPLVSTREMFSYWQSLQDFTLNADTNNLVTTSRMFDGCEMLTNVSNFNTSNVFNVDMMFMGCDNLASIPDFDISNVTTMFSTFYSCANITHIPNFNTINVTNMSSTFSYMRNLTDAPNINTSNVTNMTGLFTGCSNLTNVPTFNTSNVVDMSFAFAECENLVDIPELNTSKVTDLTSICASSNNLSNASIQNIINMCLNANVNSEREHKTLEVDQWGSPLFDTIFDNSYYQNRWAELDAAGWEY